MDNGWGCSAEVCFAELDEYLTVKLTGDFGFSALSFDFVLIFSFFQVPQFHSR
jgi:hypothetical protein